MSTPKSHVGSWWERSGGDPAVSGVCGEPGQPPVKPCPLMQSLAPCSCSVFLLWKVQPVVTGIGSCMVLTRRTHSASSLPRHVWSPRHVKPFHLLQHKKGTRKGRTKGRAHFLWSWMAFPYSVGSLLGLCLSAVPSPKLDNITLKPWRFFALSLRNQLLQSTCLPAPMPRRLPVVNKVPVIWRTCRGTYFKLDRRTTSIYHRAISINLQLTSLKLPAAKQMPPCKFPETASTKVIITSIHASF